MRRNLLVSGQIYHVFSRSIAKFVIFNNEKELSRVTETIRYYQQEKPEIKLSRYLEMKEIPRHAQTNLISEKEKLVQIIAYCIMPTHIHLILKQLKDNGISMFMSNVLNSYTKYFNTKHERKGPLWETRFKSVLVENDDYLLHLTRYIHLNPVTAELVDAPEDWKASSYEEYASETSNESRICKYDHILNTKPNLYRQFVEDRVSYQRELAKIKFLILD